MNLAELKTPEQIELFTLVLLDQVMEKHIGLSEDSSVYTRQYLGEQLSKITSYSELISDSMMQLSRISIEIIKAEGANNSRLKNKERELKDGEEYAQQHRDHKTLWLQLQLQPLRESFEQWNLLRRVVSEVKEAIAERGQTVKRLDSALRLHSKLAETLFPGPESPASRGLPAIPRGTSQSGELDIN